MLGLAKRMFRDKRNSFIIYILAAIALLEMYIVLFPALQQQASQLSQIMETYPESFFKAFNIDKSSLLFTDLGSYLAMEMFGFIWPILVIVIGVGLANYAISGEIEKGTVEVLLSQPISRVKLFFTRYLAGTSLIAIFSVVTILAIIPLAGLSGIEVDASKILLFCGVSFLFALAIFSIVMFFSALSSERSKVSFLGGGILILMYVFNVIAGLKDSLEGLKYFSLFYYYNPSVILGKGQLVDWSIIVLISVTFATTFLAAIRFKERDIAV